MRQKIKMKIKAERAFTWELLKAYMVRAHPLCSPRGQSEDRWHNTQSALHSTGQTLLKVYSEELPKPASGIAVYSKPTGEDEPREGEGQQTS